MFITPYKSFQNTQTKRVRALISFHRIDLRCHKCIPVVLIMLLFNSVLECIARNYCTTEY